MGNDKFSRLVFELSRTTGSEGIMGGQFLDLASEGDAYVDLETWNGFTITRLQCSWSARSCVGRSWAEHRRMRSREFEGMRVAWGFCFRLWTASSMSRNHQKNWARLHERI